MNNFSFGPIISNTSVTFRLWAPKQRNVSLRIGKAEPIVMNADADGWFTLRRTASHGTRYNFVLEDGCEVPDPASRFQPADVHGQSEVIDDLSYKWQQKGWLGRPWQEMVIYELHIGTFTSEGTFLSATQRLEHLAYLGVT